MTTEYILPTFGLSENHLAAIGSVCLSWAMAEQSINFMICNFIPIDDMKGKNVFCGHIDMKHKIELAKYFSRLRITDHSKFKITETFLSRLSDFGPERNRVAHDVWVVGAHPPERLQLKPSIKKPAAEPPILQTISEVSMSDNDIRKTAQDIQSLSMAVTTISFFYLRDQKDGLTPWPDISHLLPEKPNHPKRGS